MKPHPVNTRLLSMMARYRMGTAKKNAENLMDPSKYITLTKNGHTIRVVPQNRHDDYSGGVNWMVLDDSGKMGGMYGSLEDLLRQGYRRLDVQARDAQLRRTIAGPQGEGMKEAKAERMRRFYTRAAQAGYYPDKNTGVLYKATTDMEGKMVLNYSQPMSEDMYNSLLSGERPFGDDPFGLPPGTGGGGKGEAKSEKAGKKSGDEVKLPKASGSSFSDDPAAGHAAMVDWLVDAPGRYTKHLRESGGNEDDYYDPLFDLRY